MTQHTDEGVIKNIQPWGNNFNGSPCFLITMENGNVYRTDSDSYIGEQLRSTEFIGPTVRLLIKRVNRSFRVYDISII